jgi:hypothetical protein
MFLAEDQLTALLTDQCRVQHSGVNGLWHPDCEPFGLTFRIGKSWIDSSSTSHPTREPLADFCEQSRFAIFFPYRRKAQFAKLNNRQTVLPINRAVRQVIEKQLGHAPLHHSLLLSKFDFADERLSHRSTSGDA